MNHSQEKLTNDLLCQILENQATDSKLLHEMKGSVHERLNALESAQKWNKITTYIVTPFLMLGTTIARHFGVKI